MLIGYMRPYEEDLKCEQQLMTLKKANCSITILYQGSLNPRFLYF